MNVISSSGLILNSFVLTLLRWLTFRSLSRILPCHSFCGNNQSSVYKSSRNCIHWQRTTPFTFMMAEVYSFTDELEAQLTCVICNYIFTEPRSLPCLHTFCFKCIKSWNLTCQRERKRLRCPTCRALVNIEEDDISKLPSSFTYNSLLQLFDAMKMKAENQNKQNLPECVGCSERDLLVGYCPQCEGMICKDCFNNHETVKPLKRSHRATLWDEFKKQNVNSYINNQTFCKEKFHEKSRLDYHCKTCRKCICQKCAATAHSSHDKVSIEEAAEDVLKLIRIDKERLNELLIKFKKELELSNENMRRIRSEIDAAKTKVRNDTRALMKILHDQEDALIATLDDILVKQAAKNEDRESEINATIQQVTELTHQCETMEDKNLEQFILEGHENLHEVCRTTVQNKSVLPPIKSSSRVLYIPNTEAVFLMQELKLGEVVESLLDPSYCSIESVSNGRCGFVNEFKIVTRSSEENVCHTSKSFIEVQIQDVDGKDVHKELTETADTGVFLVRYEAEEPSPYKVVVIIGGKEIKNSPQYIKTVHSEYKSCMRLTHKETSNICSLAVNTRGDIALVLNDLENDARVVLFNAGGECLREIGSAALGDGQLRYPLGAVFNDDKIVICDNVDDYGCIKEFCVNGTYKGTIYKFAKGVKVANLCTFNENIACLSYDTNTKDTSVTLLSKINYDHLHDIRLAVPNSDRWEYLNLACFGDKYFVTFSKLDTVYVFDKNGSPLFTLGDESQDVQNILIVTMIDFPYLVQKCVWSILSILGDK